MLISENELFEILNQTNLPINYDIVHLIHEIYSRPPPKFNIGERCILRVKNNNNIFRQTIHIDNVIYSRFKKKYFYSYNYFPSREGKVVQDNLEKLDQNDTNKSLLLLPMDLYSIDL